MGQFDHLYAFARRVGEAEKQLRTPARFFAERSDEYLELAINVARATLAGIRPTDVDPESWQRRTEEILTAIGWSIVSPTTFRLHIKDPAAETAILPPKDQRNGFQAVTFDDVMRWIEDGVAGLPGGKRITPEDEASLADQAGRRKRANIIMRAYYSLTPNAAYERLRGQLQNFLRGTHATSPDEVMAAIATAWENAFRLRAREDLLNWMHAELSAAFRQSSAAPSASNT